jgi:hypothetical protein
VFTARYALSPYIKQIRFVFKGLMQCHAALRAPLILCQRASFPAMAFPISLLQTSFFVPAAFQFCNCSKSTASLQTTSSHLHLGFLTGLLPRNHPPSIFLGIRKSSVRTTCPAHYRLFRRKNVDSTKSSYKL